MKNMDVLVPFVLKYGAVAIFILMIVTAAAHFRLEFYEMGKKKRLKQKRKEKQLVPVPEQTLERIGEQLKDSLDFSAKKVEAQKTEIDVRVFVDGVRSEIAIRIKPQDGYFVVEPLVSDALHWNIADQVEETLAYVCGEKNTVSNDPARYEFAKLLRIRKFAKKYQWISGGALIAWLALRFLPYFLTPDYIDAVRQAVLPDTAAPIGEVFDDFFGEQEWSNAEATTDGFAFVIMEGVCYYEVEMDRSREQVAVEIDFLINEDTGGLMVQNALVNGNRLDTASQAALMEDVYESHMAQTTYQSMESLLEDYANFLGNELMEGMMGHYVSYYSEEAQEASGSEEESVSEDPAWQSEEETEERLEEETEEETEEASAHAYSDSILLWKSYDELLTDEDCEGLSKNDLRIARNEIYAAYGRIFTSQDLIDYFSEKAWYEGVIPADQFDDSVLTEVQKANIRLIQSYEEAGD